MRKIRAATAAAFFALVLALSCSILPHASAASPTDSGMCGPNAMWEYEAQTGELRIFGSGAMQDYLSSAKQPWYAYKAEIRSVKVEYGIQQTGYHAFSYFPNLTEVQLPETVTVMNGYAFAGCESLRSIALPSKLTAVNAYTFYQCTNLESIQLPDTLQTIGTLAFSGCSNLRISSFPENTAILQSAFQNCTSLSALDLINCTIWQDAFRGCSGLETVVIDGSGSIGQAAFMACTALRSVELNKTTALGTSAFSGCTSLETVHLPVSLKTISNQAFQNCTAIQDVYYAGTASQWDAVAIGDHNTCLTSAAVHVQTVPISSIQLNKSSLSMEKGTSETLIATILPSDAAAQPVIWSSSDSSVASVLEGVVTGNAAGSAIITAASADGSKQAQCSVTVWVPVSDISLNRTSARLQLGSAVTLCASVYPPDAADRTVTWSVSDPSVLTIESQSVYNGQPRCVVRAIGKGSARVAAANTSSGKSASCAIDVYTVFEAPQVSAAAAEDRITLSWESVGASAAYQVYWSTGDEIPTALFRSTGRECVCSFSRSDLQELTKQDPAQTFHFRVRAVAASGAPGSAFSNTVSVIPAPAQPQYAVSASAQGNAVTFTAPSCSEQYRYVLYLAAYTEDLKPYLYLSSNEKHTVYLKPRTEYQFSYQLQKQSDGLTSPLSASQRFSTGALCKPETPSAAASKKAVTLRWHDVPYADSYVIEISTSDRTGEPTGVGMFAYTPGTSYTIDSTYGLNHRQPYYFRIQAVTATGDSREWSAWSDAVCCTPLPPDPCSVSIVRGKAADRSGAEITQAVEGDLITLTADEPSPWYAFSGWTLSGIELSPEQQKQNPLTITMPDRNISASANYAPAQPSSGVRISLMEELKTVAVSLSAEWLSSHASAWHCFVFYDETGRLVSALIREHQSDSLLIEMQYSDVCPAGCKIISLSSDLRPCYENEVCSISALTGSLTGK